MLAGCHGRLLFVIAAKGTTPNPKHRVLGAAPGKLPLDLSERVEAWHSPGSIEIPSDEITKQPTAAPDEVTRIEGQERVPSVLSDPPRSDSIRFAAPDETWTWTSTRAPNLVLPLAGSGKTKAPRQPSRQRPGKLACQPSWSGAVSTRRRQPSNKGSKDPLSHAARDIPPRSTRPPAVPTCKKTSAPIVLCGLA